MSSDKCKTCTNVYCPSIHTQWKFDSTKEPEGNNFVKLLCWDPSYFTWNIPASINDCAKNNKSYISCLQSMSIFKYESLELFEMMKTSEQADVEIKEDRYSCNLSSTSWYLEAILKNIDLPKERLVEAYLKSRISNWSNSSIEQKYKIPIVSLHY